MLTMLVGCAPSNEDWYAVHVDGRPAGRMVVRHADQGRQESSLEAELNFSSLVGASMYRHWVDYESHHRAGRPSRFKWSTGTNSRVQSCSGSFPSAGNFIGYIIGLQRSAPVDASTENEPAMRKVTLEFEPGSLRLGGPLGDIPLQIDPPEQWTRAAMLVLNSESLQADVLLLRRTSDRMVELPDRSMRLWRIEICRQEAADAPPLVAWYGRQGTLRKARLPGHPADVELLNCSRHTALRRAPQVRTVSGHRVVSPQRLEDVEQAAEARFVLEATEGSVASLHLVDDAVQETRWKEEAVGLIVRRRKHIAAGALPYDGRNLRLLAAMKPTDYLQSEDPSIVKLTRQAVGDAGDAGTAARRIEQFVHEYIRDKRSNWGYSKAAEVARTRSGDCSEHAVLAAAMCRSAGIPAQVVGGLIYLDRQDPDLNRHYEFGLHAWVRAWVAGRWVHLDPMLGKFTVARIAISTGDGSAVASDPFVADLAATLGRFRVAEVTLSK
ncbi:MAG: transglutaminase-like domain-containing protein [Phycisphaerae bacterium]